MFNQNVQLDITQNNQEFLVTGGISERKNS